MRDKNINLDRKSINIYPDKSFAQIIFGTDSRGRTLQLALDIAKDSAIKVIEIKELDIKKREQTFLLKVLDSDMEAFILKLVEAGFNQIKGYNAATGREK